MHPIPRVSVTRDALLVQSTFRLLAILNGLPLYPVSNDPAGKEMLAGWGWDVAPRRRRWVLVEMLFVLQVKSKDVFRRGVDGRGPKLSVNRLEVDIVVKNAFNDCHHVRADR